MTDDASPLTVLLPESVSDPVEMFDASAALRMAVVERDGVAGLGAEWDCPGVYVLLDPINPDGSYGAYVGKAPSGLRGRMPDHVRKKDHWRRSLLVARDTTYGFHSAHVGWLEGRLYDLLDAAEYARLSNGNRPRDETLPAYERASLETCMVPIQRVLRLLGYNPETPSDSDEAGTPKRRTSRFFGIEVTALIASGHLAPGSRLVSTNSVYPASAKVLDDGRIEFNGDPYDTPSAAASVAKGGKAANGWDFWAIEDASGRTTLGTLRARHLDTNSGPAES